MPAERSSVLEGSLRDDVVDAGERPGARGRRPRERAAGLHVGIRHHGFGSQHRGDRLTTGGDALAHEQDVGLQVPELGGEHRSAAPEAGLHLVEHEHPSEPAAEAGQPLPERRRRREDAAFADDRLDEHAGDLLRVDLMDEKVLFDEIGVDRVVVGAGTLVEGCAEAVWEGCEHHARDVLRGVARHFGEIGAGCGRQVGGFSVVLAVEAEDHGSPGRFPGKLHACFDRLCPADAGAGAVDACGSDLHQTSSERQRRLVRDVVGDLHAVAVLGLTRSLARRRPCAERRGPPGRHMVHEGVAVDVLDQPVALARLDEGNVDVVAQGSAKHPVRSGEETCRLRTRQRGGNAGKRESTTAVHVGIHDGALLGRDGR